MKDLLIEKFFLQITGETEDFIRNGKFKKEEPLSKVQLYEKQWRKYFEENKKNAINIFEEKQP